MFNDAFALLKTLAFKSWNMQGLEYKIAYLIVLITMVSIISIIVKGYVNSEIIPRFTGGKPTSKEGKIYRNFKDSKQAQQTFNNWVERNRGIK